MDGIELVIEHGNKHGSVFDEKNEVNVPLEDGSQPPEPSTNLTPSFSVSSPELSISGVPNAEINASNEQAPESVVDNNSDVTELFPSQKKSFPLPTPEVSRMKPLAPPKTSFSEVKQNTEPSTD